MLNKMVKYEKSCLLIISNVDNVTIKCGFTVEIKQLKMFIWWKNNSLHIANNPVLGDDRFMSCKWLDVSAAWVESTLCDDDSMYKRWQGVDASAVSGEWDTKNVAVVFISKMN